ncbi:GMC family oxidoreductase [Sphingopyxis sp. H050]|jgi:choline dehydrogenase-like flavoprotein|uniref:GMC oxidoreductase n=1 Tax=Sphingopyxis sp. H050 TaxID=1759072 RepID=UPI000735E894|nr:GMC family oxidoreductase [Sphingopyxis sp. H050]KTE19835.1 GMC family oxidoreductase [Sphingopyxis sp. H050]
MEPQFDAIVVGSGITGGWSAKELTEKGLKVLMIERGPPIEHQSGYVNEMKAPWDMPFQGFGDANLYKREYFVQSKKRMFFNEYTQQHWVNDAQNPYSEAPGSKFDWFRGYQLGGKSLIWGRQCYRWSDIDFSANKTDGEGLDWPIRYADVAPWYDYVEKFIGVSGSSEGLEVLPDGHFLPAMEMRAAEKIVKRSIEENFPDRRLIIGRSANITKQVGDRGPCQNRLLCSRGCSYGAYFSTQSSTLPAARATGRLTVLTDTVVEAVDYDPRTGRATGVRTVGTKDKKRQAFTARLVVMNAGTINTNAILLRSRSERFPNGLANDSGALGRYLMDHASATSAVGLVHGIDDRAYYGNRPNNVIVPRFRNVGDDKQAFHRGYMFQGGSSRRGWKRGGDGPGLGADLKKELEGPGPWSLFLGAFAECMPNAENRVMLHKSKRDLQGLEQVEISFNYGENELAALRDAEAQARAMLEKAGATVVMSSAKPDTGGSSIHEMGGARMGADPKQSVLNAFNQAHDVPNLLVTDGACMNSSACQNPSLTYMALTARACDNAVKQLKEGAL